MKNHIFLSMAVLTCLTSGCGNKPDQKSANEKGNADSTTTISNDRNYPTPVTERKFEAKGITYVVREDKSLGVSVSRITVIATDSTHTDSLNLGDKDPVRSGMLADLDENNQDELYLVT